ncbi:hypothetical protein J437_LFUL014057 [Ladona fulva]|uniref:Uncharacterized protein n=1 Tax=Ladona fulva TaxID=123851 RepID=A0A8K0KQT8_LADFU|nr:hypothetical protein J437_LFUL014057 [Ladona fulva]
MSGLSIIVSPCSSHDVWKSAIDAKHNWWGYNESVTVGGRVKDRRDEQHLLEVDFEPFHLNNVTLLGGKCPPGWTPVGDTCYIYVGVPMNFMEARDFCRSDNASMPYVMSNYAAVYQFLKEQQDQFSYYDKVWVQHIDMINRCTVFAYQSIKEDDCVQLYPFICEQDPKVSIDPLSWTGDVVTIGVIGAVIASVILVALVAGFWYTKSKHRHVERLERRNSIRASMRSLASSHGGFNELGYRRKQPSVARASPTPTKMSEYRKMNGSIDSMDKSQFNSSVDDNQSYDIYEAHNPNAIPYGYSQFDQSAAGMASSNATSFDLAYRNEGFRDNSTFASRETCHVPPPPPPPPLIRDDSSLPLDCSLMSDSTLDLKRDEEDEVTSNGTLPHCGYFYGMPAQQEGQLLETDLPAESQQEGQLLETDLDHPVVPSRSKSEALLETNFEFVPVPSEQDHFPLFSRSKSQPLETAM